MLLLAETYSVIACHIVSYAGIRFDIRWSVGSGWCQPELTQSSPVRMMQLMWILRTVGVFDLLLTPSLRYVLSEKNVT